MFPFAPPPILAGCFLPSPTHVRDIWKPCMVSLGLPTFPPVDSCPLWYMFFCHRAVLQSKVRIGRAVWDPPVLFVSRGEWSPTHPTGRTHP